MTDAIDGQALAAEIDALDYSALRVQPEYIDLNGHMNVGYYTVLFDRALDLPWARLGIYSALILETGKSSFALESHLTYKQELKEGDPIAFDFQLLDFDAKRIHYFLRMWHAERRYLAATCEQLSICVDMRTRRSTAWPESAIELITALHAAHQSRPRPPEAGRAIGIRR